RDVRFSPPAGDAPAWHAAHLARMGRTLFCRSAGGAAGGCALVIRTLPIRAAKPAALRNQRFHARHSSVSSFYQYTAETDSTQSKKQSLAQRRKGAKKDKPRKASGNDF